MPEIELDAMQIQAFQRLLYEHDIEIPDERQSLEEWRDEKEAVGEPAHPEDYPHDTDLERLLYQLGNACPICGDPECDDGVAYVGAQPIHASQHPEAVNERAMDNRGMHL